MNHPQPDQTTQAALFSPGDRVKVLRGQYAHKHGAIVSLNGDRVRVQLDGGKLWFVHPGWLTREGEDTPARVMPRMEVFTPPIDVIPDSADFWPDALPNNEPLEVSAPPHEENHLSSLEVSATPDYDAAIATLEAACTTLASTALENCWIESWQRGKKARYRIHYRAQEGKAPHYISEKDAAEVARRIDDGRKLAALRAAIVVLRKMADEEF